MKESLVIEAVLKVDLVLKEVTTCHKGIYSKILKIKDLFMTSQRSHVMTMWFYAFSHVFCAGLGQVFSL